MIVFTNGMWVDEKGNQIKTNSQLYKEAVDRDNIRVGKEWDAIMPVCGNQYEAIQLAILQGSRSIRLAEKYGY